MKFTLATLLLFVTAFAIAFAMVSNPSGFGADAVYVFHVLAAATALVIARYTKGSIHAYALTFGVFGFATHFMHACPYDLQQWIYENITYDGPDTLPMGNGWEMGPHRIIATWFDLLIALFAASLASSIIRGFENDDAETATQQGEPSHAPKDAS
ncbi:hypothetical protein Enr13x_18720 [Stieleria neptunia]|uniref:Uncharacterized protein n=1 Tax=Stieleria neptunia TaxID=2527979 RepID=A0A518HMK1_9BACT|nr:hypothetical protein [Stieleria neptunia]QDV42029.1 hypothetical protein Enr13x_18720 [Stieleria neptunia]